MKQRLLSLFAMLSLIVSGAMAQSLTVADITAEAGQEATITVNIAGAAEMTALQFNLSLPEGFTLAGDITLGAAAQGHTLSANALASGELLIVLYDLYQSTFADGTLLTIPVVAAEDAASGEARLYTVHAATAAAVSHTLSNVTFAMNIAPKEVAVSGITLDQTAATLTEGETLTLTATVTPDDATDKTVTWETSDAAIATVENGVVTAVAPGEVTITAKAGEHSATCVVTVEKKVIAVSGIALDQTAATLTEGESLTLVATVSPDDATDKTVTWETSDAAIATVVDGVVTAVAPGEAIITATAGEHSATCVVTVEKKVIAVGGITLDQTAATLTEGETLTLTATVSPDDATDKTVTWETSDAAIATVENGVVTAVAPGEVTITAKAGDKEATCVVTVEKKVIAVSGIALDQTAATLTEGETLTLTATVSPDDATDKTVTWETSDVSVATVADGVVTAVAPGEVIITAKAGDKEATCVITVEAAAVEPEPVYAEIENGDYYLQNVGSGKFLVGANSWGTQASLGQRGVSITLERLPNGKYTLDTHIANNDTDHYLGSNGYMDAPAAEWTIVEPAPGVYALTLDEVSYWGYDGSSAILTGTLTDATQPAAQWQLVTRTMLEEALAQAAQDNPVDATFFIKGADFNRNHTDNNAWQGGPVLGGRSEQMCAEKWNTTFDVYQDLVGLPNGYYRLSVQGFYRDGGSATENRERHAILYAGDTTIPLMSILDDEDVTDTPNSMDAASDLFAAGHYTGNSVMVEVTGGALRIGIRKEVLIGSDWTIFDNFELYYLGTEVTGIESSVLEAQGSQLIYDLTGRRVEKATKGIYIVGGKKVVIR